jgi:hypothetical protein
MRRQSVKQYARNPIRSLSCEEMNEDIRNERAKNKNKADRVSAYMGSENFKNSTYVTFSEQKSDKITNNDFNLISNQKKQKSALYTSEAYSSVKRGKNSSFIF